MKVNLKIAKPKNVPYSVKGKNYSEAAKYLMSKPYSACYEANPKFSFKFNNEGNTYETTIIAKPKITIPKWSGSSKLKGDEKNYWTSMMRALAKHETKHHKIFEDDARKFKKDTEIADDFPKGETTAKKRTFFTSSQTKQDSFDKRSSHGENEGAVLPV